MKQVKIDQLREYSSFFSRSSGLSMIEGDFSDLDIKIERYESSWKKETMSSYLDFIKYSYDLIKNKYKNEYVIKNEFINNWLFDELSEVDSEIFSEFRIGDAIADLAIFNGHSKAFEIKTEFDSDKRLTQQIKSYESIFDFIYLIVPQNRLTEYLQKYRNIGIISYSDRNDDLFKLERKAPQNFEKSSDTMINLLRTKEYKSIVIEYFGYLPDMTSFSQFKICKELIIKIPVDVLNKLFIKQIKKRNKRLARPMKHHKEINQLALALRLSHHDRLRLIQELKSPIQ